MADVPGPSDLSLFEWIIGGIGTVASIFLGNLHVRHNRMEDRLSAVERDARETAATGDNALWSELRTMSDKNQTFREDMLRNVVTKADLAAMETRLKQAMSGKVAVDGS